jgi:hypothetical protein
MRPSRGAGWTALGAILGGLCIAILGCATTIVQKPADVPATAWTLYVMPRQAGRATFTIGDIGNPAIGWELVQRYVTRAECNAQRARSQSGWTNIAVCFAEARAWKINDSTLPPKKRRWEWGDLPNVFLSYALCKDRATKSGGACVELWVPARTNGKVSLDVEVPPKP